MSKRLWCRRCKQDVMHDGALPIKDMDDFAEKWFQVIVHKNARIRELEREVSQLRSDWADVAKEALLREKEVKALKEGACRFNCRTGKSNWAAGYKFAIHSVGLVTDKTAVNEDYELWKEMKDEVV